MTSEFEAEVSGVVERIHPAHRDEARADVHRLVVAGGTSRPALASILINPQAGEIRSVACWLLGRLEATDQLTALLQSLTDPAPRLRMTAAIALGECGSAQAVPALSTALSGDTDEATRAAAAWALGEIAAPTAVSDLLAALANARRRPSGARRMARHVGSVQSIRMTATKPLPLVIEFIAGARIVREEAIVPKLPILENGPPGTFVVFADGRKVPLPTDQIVRCDDTSGAATVGLGGMSFEGLHGGKLVFYRVQDLAPAHELSPERARRMTLEPGMVASILVTGRAVWPRTE